MNKMKKIILGMVLICFSLNLFSQSFYELSTIQTIEVHMSQSNWDTELDNAYATTGDYIMADSVVINGVTFDSVGVKYKGNSSYNASQTKNPWHIELDTYKDQDYQGYKDIKLANVAKDPSFLRDVLGYQVVRQYMAAPLANYANLSVNGTLIGLYSNTEAITKTFVKDRFGSKTNTFFSCSPPDGASPTSGDYPNLVYLGTDSSNYYDAYEIKSDNGWNHLIALCDTLENNMAGIESVLDVDRAIWMLAFDNAIVNLDSYIGAFSQNYYLYQDDYGRFLPVVWDLNESFGTFSNTGSGNLNSISAKQQMSHLLHNTDVNFPLISKMLAVPTYKKMYLAHLKTIMEENFTNNGNYYTMAQTLQNTADASVQADPNKFYTYAQFLSNLTSDVTSGPGGGPGGPGGPVGNSVPGITNLMNSRYSHLMSQNDFTVTEPTISDIALSTSTPLVGNTITVTANVANTDNVYLRYRNEEHAPFEKVEMFDDGNHNDGIANDNIFGAEIIINSLRTQYYIYAENSDIGKFSPVRAQHEFYTINVTGGITPGDIVINEFMASNDTTVADQDGEYDDWIELYNNSSSAIDISGYVLSDDIADLTLFEFPTGTTIQADDYIIVWADKDLSQAGYHTNFKISSGGETLYLFDASQQIIDSVAFGSQNTDEAFGRYPNGTGAFQTLKATFGAKNTNGNTVSINEIEQTINFKIYPNPVQNYFTVEISDNSFQNNNIVIYNFLGQEIYITNAENETTIYTDNWTAGIYYVKIGNTFEKIIVNK